VKPLYLSCVVEQEAASTIRVLRITWRETLLANQCSLLVTKTLHARANKSSLQYLPPAPLYIWNSLLMLM